MFKVAGKEEKESESISSSKAISGESDVVHFGRERAVHKPTMPHTKEAIITLEDLPNLCASIYGTGKSVLLAYEEKKAKEFPKEKHVTLKYKDIFLDSRAHDEMKWKLNQVFGEDPNSVNEGEPYNPNSLTENVITSVEFDPSGEFLAIGYQCGQIVIFRNAGGHTFKFFTQFESHHPEFDFLTSLEIEEKINRIRWLSYSASPRSRSLLSTNDKTIKLWRVTDTKGGVKPLQRRVFGNGHAYNINSLSLCSDGQLFLSADDLRINLWDLENSTEAFNVVDIKPASMSELNEVITSARFHPQESHTFAYASSKGQLYLADMRTRALCDRPTQRWFDTERTKSFFSEVTSSISDLSFSSNGRYLLTRDYLHLKMWDVRMGRGCVSSYEVHEHLRPKLYELYENDTLFDKFECGMSGNGLHVVTGSYSNNFLLFDLATSRVNHLQAVNPRDRRKRREVPTVDRINFSEKVLHVAWHPTYDVAAIAAGNYIYLYHLASQ